MTSTPLGGAAATQAITDTQATETGLFGEACVVWLRDGRIFVKIPMPGSSSDKFNLLSLNPHVPAMTDVEVVSNGINAALDELEAAAGKAVKAA